jgi:hypothetical protein
MGRYVGKQPTVRSGWQQVNRRWHCQRYGMDCCTMDECIAPYGVHYIGGRDPLGPAARRAAARGGASSGGDTWGRQHPLKP